jgi:malonyl-CoA decarboxylase
MPARNWLAQFTLIAQRGRQFLGGAATIVGRRDDAAACHRLLRQRGEASSLVLAAEILAHIAGASAAETERFLTMLATEFGPSPAAVSLAARSWLATPSAENLAALAKVVEPPRQELFRRLNMIPGGTSALLALRADLLALMPARPDLAPVDADLKHLFTSWFNRGFLRLEEITWETSADILERLTGYEAVHEMRGWRDLRGRLASDRRCFAFFHPSLPREPLIFVEVALTHGLPSSVDPLIRIDRTVLDSANADTAIFYSISNAQAGLRGISFGSFLIKQVMGQLTKDFPKIKTYATISPMRQFAAALRATGNPDGFTPERIERLLGDAAAPVRGWLDSGEPAPESLDAALSLLGLAYLTRVKSGFWAADPVAHFHLSNGARIERINARADVGEHAAASVGLMVNYLYDAAHLEVNHEQYVERGWIAVAPAVHAALAKVNAAWDGG